MKIHKNVRKALASAIRNTFHMQLINFVPGLPTGMLVCATVSNGKKLTATFERRTS